MKMHVDVYEGDGPHVALVHGIPGSGAVWHEVASILAGEHRVFVPDLLGFGESERPHSFDDLWVDAQGSALRDALTKAGAVRPIVVGHDFGGPVALAMLRDAEMRRTVRGVGLVAANVFGDTPIPFPIRGVTWPFVGNLAARLLFSRSALAFMIRQGSSKALKSDDYLGDERQSAAIGTIFRNALRGLSELYAPIEGTLRELDIPVLVAWGDRDPFFAIRQAQRTASAARLGRLSIYSNARHFLPGERPAELAADIRRLVADAVR